MAWCYTHEQVPPLGIVEEMSQSFVDLDERGRVLLNALPDDTGEAWGAGESSIAAFLWSGGQPEPIVVEEFLQTSGQALNERGEVLLLATNLPGPEEHGPGMSADWTHAVLWQDGSVVATIAAPDGLIFTHGRLNELGHVALTTDFDYNSDAASTPPPRTYLWRDGQLVDLGEGALSDFNDHDEITGYDFDLDEFVMWRQGERHVFPTGCASGPESMAAIHLNEHGRAAASFWCDDKDVSLTWSGDEVVELPTLAGQAMAIADLNDRGEIVGVVRTDEGEVPVRWHDGDELIVVPLPRDAPSGELGDIDERGRFIGAYGGDPFGGDGSHGGFFFVGDEAGTHELPLDSLWGSMMIVGEINEKGVIVNSMAGDVWDHERTIVWRPCDPGSP
ncbi:hypothetical protein [Nannocystis punicea]|uniref:Uncharacterized protein n=1 Tax=Nannocystis punicea TaxID=2995304 RepID=A0ABY7GTN3_9BACT|nr:hypothetical protein [Nannocystis poenicansa]WAS90329.1 hypothetical protein O0S08_29420 [Nannocystis poenicansa]